MKEVLTRVVDIMKSAAGEDSERRASGYHWIRHGGREAIVAGDYYALYPEDLPVGATIQGVKFGALVHDIGKTICVRNPGIWNVNGWKITPGEWKEIASHVTATINMLAMIQVPEEALDYAAYHHEKLDGSGYFGIKADGLSHPARLAGVVDQLVARCENREYRYGTPQLSFVAAFEDVNSGRGRLFDESILLKVWEMYKHNPFIYQRGYQWVFQNGHLHRT